MTENSYIDHDLIARIDAFLSVSRMTPTAFGRAVANDSMLVTQIKEGRELRRKTREKIKTFIEKQESDLPEVKAS